MEHLNTTPAKIPILDTRKFAQWKFRIQQYLQNEHYALWEVIEFGDSYVVLKESAATGSASDGKKGRTVAITTEDMQKRRNNVKARTTLLLALPDEHQLRFKLWAAILKTFGGNEATRKTKKNLLKQQYGNFKAKGKETLEKNFNRLQAIVCQLEFIDVEIEQDDLNQKSDLDTMSLDDLYNHLKVYEPEVQKKLDSQNMAFISSSKNSSGNEEDNTTSSYMANDEENHALVVDEEAPIEFALMAKTNTDNDVFDNSLCSKACKKNTDSLNSQITELSEKLGDTKNMLYHYKLGLSQTGLLEFADDTITDYSRPSPAIESKTDEFQNKKPSVTETGSSSDSTILSKPAIKFVKAVDRPTKNKTDKVKAVKKPIIQYAELYRKTSKKSNVRRNQRNWNNLKSQQL
nr:hypothetical protein [Tanacetum cinerariifolium]